ncbi:MAG: T9SS type A sorting domain-containing protein, partial [Ignavibacteria bacterium]|nr:T9SS type A sorting domain-containing protein [Ignavibacteria bacterium]
DVYKRQPFNSVTDIEFILNKSSSVKLIVYNSLGQEITTLLNDFLSAGKHIVKFKTSLADNLASGIYFISLKTEAIQKTIKAVLLK